MLEAGRVDYVVASFANGMRLIGSLGLDGKVEALLSRTLKEDNLYVIFSKERISPAFVDAFSNALHQFKQTEASRALNTLGKNTDLRARLGPPRLGEGKHLAGVGLDHLAERRAVGSVSTARC
jgi:polar amino acid transport system substrate-binding protein